jgi:hypothetical protein
MQVTKEAILAVVADNNLTLDFGGTGTFGNRTVCARAALTYGVFGNTDHMYSNLLKEKLGLRFNDIGLAALEAGFEGYNNLSEEEENHPFYQVGRELALVIDPEDKNYNMFRGIR